MRLSPGACPICGAAHTSCRGPEDRDVQTITVPLGNRSIRVVTPLVTSRAVPGPSPDSAPAAAPAAPAPAPPSTAKARARK